MESDNRNKRKPREPALETRCRSFDGVWCLVAAMAGERGHSWRGASASMARWILMGLKRMERADWWIRLAKFVFVSRCTLLSSSEPTDRLYGSVVTV